MNHRVSFGFLFLVSAVSYSQKSTSIELFKSPKKTNFALNVPGTMLLDEGSFFKRDFKVHPSKEKTLPENIGNTMPIFESSSKHNTPVFPIDSTRTHFLKVYAVNGMDR